jgi:hypothetical protein
MEGRTVARKSKGFLAFLVLLVGAAVSAGVAAWLLLFRLPDPEDASPRDLLRWVVTQDLNDHSIETRRMLVRRLDESFGGQIKWSAKGQEPLAPAQQERMLQNVALLAEPWFLEKLDGYFALPPKERTAYVDRILDSFETWRGADQLMGSVDKSTGKRTQPQTGMIGTILKQIEQCREQATAEERQKMDEFVLAVQGRWLWRTLLAPRKVTG